MNEGIERIIAQTYAALGDPRAALASMRADDAEEALAEDAVTDTMRVEQIQGLLKTIPEPSAAGKHDDTCHLRHPRCLAAKIRELVEAT